MPFPEPSIAVRMLRKIQTRPEFQQFLLSRERDARFEILLGLLLYRYGTQPDLKRFAAMLTDAVGLSSLLPSVAASQLVNGWTLKVTPEGIRLHGQVSVPLALGTVQEITSSPLLGLNGRQVRTMRSLYTLGTPLNPQCVAWVAQMTQLLEHAALTAPTSPSSAWLPEASPEVAPTSAEQETTVTVLGEQTLHPALSRHEQRGAPLANDQLNPSFD